MEELRLVKAQVYLLENILNLKLCNTKYYQQDCTQSLTKKEECMYSQRVSTHTYHGGEK